MDSADKYLDEPPRRVLLTGAIAGVGGGGMMALFAMSLSYYAGAGFWTPMLLIAGVIFGDAALNGGASVLLAGILIHFAMSVTLGLIFAAGTARAKSSVLTL